MAHSGGETENRLKHGMHLIPARERHWGTTTVGNCHVRYASGPDKRLLMGAQRSNTPCPKPVILGVNARKCLDLCVSTW
jgi:hypothetical protein